jgi:hypothetical protein
LQIGSLQITTLLEQLTTLLPFFLVDAFFGNLASFSSEKLKLKIEPGLIRTWLNLLEDDVF